MTLPNAITFARIFACPFVAYLTLAPGTASRYAAFLLYLAAALSDIWDGHLARKYRSVTDAGKLLDPLANKLLLVSTFVPFYFLTRGDELGGIPWWGELPIWVLVVVLGRELLMTAFRSYAARRGVVIAAGRTGKYKTLAQCIFAGALLLWYPTAISAAEGGWSGALWVGFRHFHGLVIAVSLALAVALTVLSMADYLWRYREVVAGAAPRR